MNRFVNKKNLLYFGVVFFVFFYTFFDSYCVNVFISPDTADYLREAENLYRGYGFNNNGLAGGEGWFSLFPILYPALICCFMYMTGTNAYLSSKILCCCCLMILCIILKKRLKTNYHFCALFFLNFGFIWCLLYSWSEIPFILFIAMSVFALSDFMNGRYDWKQGFCVLITCCLAFSTRYYGLFLFFVVGFWTLILFASKNKRLRVGGRRLLIVDVLFAVYSSAYFYINGIMSGFATGGKRFVFTDSYWGLTKNLFESLFAEVWGFCGNLIHGMIFLKGELFLFFAIMTVALVAIISLKLRKKIDFAKMKPSLQTKVFFVAGLFYYVIFIVYRYMSSMDPFFYRLFIPGTFLLFVAVVDALRDVRVYKVTKISFFALICLLIVSYGVFGFTYYKKDGFLEVAQQLKKKYEWMKPQSKVVYCYPDIEYPPSLVWLRSDIIFTAALGEKSFLKSDGVSAVYVDKKITECNAFSVTDSYLYEQIRKSPEKSGFWVLYE